MPARYSEADYAAGAIAMLPQGRVWPRTPDSEQAIALGAMAKTFARSDASGSALLDNALPGDNLDLLTDWESSLGLPDPCAGPDATTEQRANQVRARFIGGGGQSRRRYIEFAATLGFTIEIEVYAPFRVERSTVESLLYDEEWSFTWGVNVLANATGLSTDVLLCELNAIKPAETTVFLIT